MRRTLFVCCALAVGSVLSIQASDETAKAKGSVCWPLHFAGVTVGLTTDAQVQRLLGRGVYRPDEGHTGGRYFLDLKRTSTLHVVEGVDRVVEELTLRNGIDAALKPTEYAVSASRWLNPGEGFGNWHALHLGSTMAEALENLGEPVRKLNNDEWVYEKTCTCGLSEYFTLAFKNSRVVQLSLSAEE